MLTLTEAAEVLHCVRQTVQNWISAGRLKVVAERPRRVLQADVLQLRAQVLHRVGGVEATRQSLGAPVAGQQVTEDDSVTELRVRVAGLEDLLRQVAASREMIANGLNLMQRGEQGLLDALLATLPAQQPGVER